MAETDNKTADVKPHGIKPILKKIMIGLYRCAYPVLIVHKKVVVFDSSIGLNYTGSPRAIYERMVELGLDKKYKCVWFFQKGKCPENGIPGSAKIVRYGRSLYLYYMCIAGVWVFDARQPKFIKKKEEQHYIQTWHGTPLKKLALDLDNMSMWGEKDLDQYKRNFAANTATWDYLIAQNEFSDRIFRRCFDFHKTMLHMGYPRNDVLFRKNNPEDILKLKEQYGLPTDKKILLYAPTWRDDEYLKSGVYRFRPQLDFMALKKAFEGEYVVAVKYHYLVGESIDWTGYEGFIYPFTGAGEISGLYLVADALITDYSSVMFDYSLLKKPMYFYAYDLEKYRDELKGFYFDFLGEIPGPVSQTTEELIADIRKYGTDHSPEFAEREKAFYEKFGGYEDGHACDTIIELIAGLTK